MKTIKLLIITCLILFTLAGFALAHGTHLIKVNPTFSDNSPMSKLCSPSNPWNDVVILYNSENLGCYVLDVGDPSGLAHVISVPSCGCSEANRLMDAVKGDR